MSVLLATSIEQVDGYAVRVARLGVDKVGTPLILMHGYPENLQVWCRLAPLLARERPVIAFDWPGMGESAPWKGGATPRRMAERLRRLLDAWGLDHVHLLGSDMGGQPSLVAAARFPDRIRSVVVMNSLVMGHIETSWEIEVLRQYRWNLKILRHLPSIVFFRARQTFLARQRSVPKAVLEDFWRCFRRTEVRQFIVRMCAGYQRQLAKLPDDYRRITCPVLVLWGDSDKHFPVKQAEALRAELQDGTMHVVAGGHHWMMLEKSDALATRMERFFLERVRDLSE